MTSTVMMVTVIAGCAADEGRAHYSEHRSNGAELFVSPSGGDLDPCTAQFPCSVAEAIDLAQRGDEIVFMDGTYDLDAMRLEQLRTQRAGVTFRAEHLHQAIVTSTNFGIPIIHIDQSDTIVQGLVLDCAGEASGIVLHDGEYEDILIEDNVIRNTGRAGIAIGRRQSRIQGVEIKGNTIHTTGLSGFNGEGILIGLDDAEPDSFVEDVEIEGNELVLTPENGLECTMGAKTREVSFHHNIVHTFHAQPWNTRPQDGLISCAAEDVDIYRNYFYDGTIASSLIAVSEHSDLRIHDNVFESIDGSSTFIATKLPVGDSALPTLVEDNWLRHVEATGVEPRPGWVVQGNVGVDEPLDPAEYEAFKAELLEEIAALRGHGDDGGGDESDDDDEPDDGDEPDDAPEVEDPDDSALTNKSTPVDASDQADANSGPANTLDDDLHTRWSAEGSDEWIRYDLETTAMVTRLSIAWFKGDVRRASFKIQVSESDSGPWTTVYAGTSSGETAERETYDVEDTEGRWVRIVGEGNTINDWNSISEVVVLGY